MRLVLIEWADSYGCSPSWQPLDDVEPRALTCKSVGWLLRDDADIKVIVPHVSVPTPGITNQGCGDMTIPTRAVVRMVDLLETQGKRRRKLTSG